MKRREVLRSAAAALALAPFGAGAQPGLPTVGYLSSFSVGIETPFLTTFLDGLKRAGFMVGHNVAIEYRFAEGQSSRLPALAAELVGLPVAVLVAGGVPAAVAAKQATATIPIVFSVGRNPVQLGLVGSLSRPGGNATGMSALVSELGPKRLELLRELLPRARLIAVLFDPTTPSTPLQIPEVETAAQAAGQPILVLQARNDDEIETAFATMAQRQADGLLYGATSYFQTIADKLVALASRYRIPALYEWPQFVKVGGLMSYSTSRGEYASLTGDYVARVLRGASPADLPVVQSTRFELVINLKTAKALGLTVPHALLQRADEIIE